MRTGDIGIEPEGGVLDPLDVLVTVRKFREIKIGIEMPGEEVAGIAAKEIGVGKTGNFQQRGGDILGNPARMGIEEFRNHMRLAVQDLKCSVGILPRLEPLADPEPGGNAVRAAACDENQGEAAAIGAQAMASCGGVPSGLGRVGVAAISGEIGEEPVAIMNGRFSALPAQAGGGEPILKGVRIPVDRSGGSEIRPCRWVGEGRRGGIPWPGRQLARAKQAGDLDSPMKVTIIPRMIMERADEKTMGRIRVVCLDLPVQTGTELLDVLGIGFRGNREVEDGRVRAISRPLRGVIIDETETMTARYHHMSGFRKIFAGKHLRK